MRLARYLQFSQSSFPQLLGSLQALLIGVLIARASTVEQFGEFGVAFAALTFVVTMIRTVSADVFLFHLETSSRTKAMASNALSFALAAGLCAAVFILCFLPVAHTFGYQIIWLAVAIPSLVLQDTTRNLLVGVARARVATVLDLALLVALVAGLFLLPRELNPFIIQVMWVVCLGAVGISGAIILSSKISISNARTWWGPHNHLWRYLADFALTNSLTPLAVGVTTAIAGLPGAAALRAAQMVIAPGQVLNRAMSIAYATPARRAAEAGDRNKLRRLSIQLSALLALASIAISVTAAVLPLKVLENVFGDSAAVMIDVLPATFATLIAISLATGTGLAFRALRRIEVTVLLKAVSLPISVVALLAGALSSGAVGAQAGIALGESVRAALGWLLLLKRPQREEGKG